MITDKVYGKSVCFDTKEILRKKSYLYREKKIDLQLMTGVYNFEEFELLKSSDWITTAQKEDEFMQKQFYAPEHSYFEQKNIDCLTQAAQMYRPLLVLPIFFNRMGDYFFDSEYSQTEQMCQCSTLSAVYSSKNLRQKMDMITTDDHCLYLIFSPQVAVFRNEKGELLEYPYPISVISVCFFDCHKYVDEDKKKQLIIESLSMVHFIAARKMYRNVILLEIPQALSLSDTIAKECFEEVLINRHFQECFEHVILLTQTKCLTSKHSQLLLEEKHQIQSGYKTGIFGMPVCNHHCSETMQKKSIGYVEGIFEDGIFFQAELCVDDRYQTRTLLFVLPYQDMRKSEFHMITDKTLDRMELYKNQELPMFVLCQGMKRVKERIGTEQLQGYMDYLIRMGAVHMLNPSTQLEAEVCYDLDWQPVIALWIELIRNGKTNAFCPFTFVPFT